MNAITEWTFLAPGCPRATGGDIARFEIVNEIARRPAHRVRVVHLPTREMRIRDLTDLPWFQFDPAVEHQFAVDLDPDRIPDTDVVVYSTKAFATALAPPAPPAGRQLVDALLGGGRTWLPVALLQGHGVFPPVIEELAFHAPGPKVCVGSALAATVVAAGVPTDEVVHIPNGLDHERFRLLRPIEHRAPMVTMNFDPFRPKRGPVGIRALEDLHERLRVPACVFGTIAPSDALGTGLQFELGATQDDLVAIYNAASLFLQPSLREGFGMCAVESMACGCALVTTDNGGSADYAIDGETAIVCGGDPDEMTDALARLVVDDPLRIRIATNGTRLVERFRWSTSADQMIEVAMTRVARGPAARPDSRIDLDRIVADLG